MWGAKWERMHLENLKYVLSLIGHGMRKHSKVKIKLFLD
jgi:hypothetical protein